MNIVEGPPKTLFQLLRPLHYTVPDILKTDRSGARGFGEALSRALLRFSRQP